MNVCRTFTDMMKDFDTIHLFDSSQIMMTVKNRELLYIFANRSFRSFFNQHSEKEFEGGIKFTHIKMGPFEAGLDEESQRNALNDDKAILEGMEKDTERIVTFMSERKIKILKRPVTHNTTGEIIGVIGNYYDITEQEMTNKRIIEILFNMISTREHQALMMFAEGHSVREIAHARKVTPGTIINNLRRIKSKVGESNFEYLTRYIKNVFQNFS